MKKWLKQIIENLDIFFLVVLKFLNLLLMVRIYKKKY